MTTRYVIIYNDGSYPEDGPEHYLFITDKQPTDEEIAQLEDIYCLYDKEWRQKKNEFIFALDLPLLDINDVIKNKKREFIYY